MNVSAPTTYNLLPLKIWQCQIVLSAVVGPHRRRQPVWSWHWTACLSSAAALAFYLSLQSAIHLFLLRWPMAGTACKRSVAKWPFTSLFFCCFFPPLLAISEINRGHGEFKIHTNQFPSFPAWPPALPNMCHPFIGISSFSPFVFYSACRVRNHFSFWPVWRIAQQKLRCGSPSRGIEDQWNFFDSAAFRLHSLSTNRHLPDSDTTGSL